MDMASGGGRKEKGLDYIYIEAPEEEAKVIFYNRFGHNPDRVSCTCCGADYSISSEEDLAQITAFERGCRMANFDRFGNEVDDYKKGVMHLYVEAQGAHYRPYQTLEEWQLSSKALFIHASEIKPEEREGEVPEQGYVWRG